MSEEQAQTEHHTISTLEPNMRLEGVVKEAQLYGAVVDIGLEYDGVVHISQLSSKRVNRVADVVQPGDSVSVWVTKVDPEKGRIGLTMVEPPQVAWKEMKEGQIHTGTVRRLEQYGAFVDIGAERDGLLHVGEMSAGYVRHPSEMVKVGEEVDVRILKVDRRRRRIDLTMKGVVDQIVEDPEEEERAAPKTTMEVALERAQAQQQARGQRQERQKRASSDLSGREDILARTLEQHSEQT